MLSFSDSLDREAQLYRVPDTPDLTGTFGDDIADPALVGTVSCRIELTDDGYWTVWMDAESVAPEHEDQLVFASGLTIYIKSVKPWTLFDGTFHHYEIRAVEDPDDERWARRG